MRKLVARRLDVAKRVFDVPVEYAAACAIALCIADVLRQGQGPCRARPERARALLASTTSPLPPRSALDSAAGGQRWQFQNLFVPLEGPRPRAP